MAIRFQAPTGYQELDPELEYTLLRNDRQLRHRVLLVGFRELEDGRHSPHLVRMPQDAFKTGICPPKPGQPAPMQAVKKPSKLPRWSARFEDIENLDGVPALVQARKPKPNRKKKTSRGNPRRTKKSFKKGSGSTQQAKKPSSVREDTQARLARISVALQQADRILESPNPDLELNRLARACSPVVHESRYRLWFYLYLAFDFNFWALMPDRSACGIWVRTDEKYEGRKFGAERKHYVGTPSQWSSKAMIDKMVEGFKKRANLGDTLVQVWSKVIRLDFHAEIKEVKVKTADGRSQKRFAAFPGEKSDPNLGLPSYDKFRYYTKKILGDYVRLRLFGALAVEMKNVPTVGTYHDGLDNVGQQFNFDSYQVKDRPRGYLGNYHCPPLKMVDLVDASTGHIEGIGPDLGSESHLGYLVALFTAAIQKSLFGKIIGYPISDEEWPSRGLPRKLFSDRGPGASAQVRAAAGRWVALVEMSRSYTPKDNSMVEAKHPRKKKSLGAPMVALSDLTVGESIKREVERVILQNRTGRVGSRTSDEMVVENAVNTPETLRAALLADYRSSLIQISFEEAVRAFLPKVLFQCKGGKLFLKHRQYYSPKMADSGLAQFLHDRRSAQFEIEGYVFPLATRYTWVEFNGQMIWLEAQGTDKPEVMNASLWELEVIQKARSEAEGDRQALVPFATAQAHDKFRRETGKEWGAGKTKRGPHKVTREALDEARRMRSAS